MKLFEGVTLRGGLEKTGNVFKIVQYTQQMLINLSSVHETWKKLIELELT